MNKQIDRQPFLLSIIRKIVSIIVCLRLIFDKTCPQCPRFSLNFNPIKYTPIYKADRLCHIFQSVCESVHGSGQFFIVFQIKSNQIRKKNDIASMKKLLICLFVWCCYGQFSVYAQSFSEKHRLQVHFSVPFGWANDPNGLIYADGAYHLYYQHYPNGITPVVISWGHAKSYDLIHWINMPIAIPSSEKGAIFSGCCVLDKNNLTGVIPTNSNDLTPIIAIYTLSSNVTGQTQCMAYSVDNGVTFTQYANNPLISNPGIPDFRDPNIFERNGIFYMALAVKDRLQFYSSKNLLSWTYLSDFGVAPNEGDKSGVWECPSLITLKDEQNNEHDLIILSVNNNDNLNFGQTTYFIGKWNGTAFNSYNKTSVLRADYGFDNYAGIPFHNDPLGRVILIGWMSNWMYAQVSPTTAWRGQMTIARELTLKTINGQPHLAQRPINAFNTTIDASRMWSLQAPLDIAGQQVVDVTSHIPFKTGSMLTLDYAVDISNAANGKVELKFGNSKGEFVSFGYSIGQVGIYELDRSKSGDTSFSPKFASTVARAERIATGSLLSGKIILDTASIEIFADDGLNTFSALLYPTELYETIQLNVTQSEVNTSKTLRIQKLSVAALNSIWKNDFKDDIPPNGSLKIGATMYCMFACLIFQAIFQANGRLRTII